MFNIRKANRGEETEIMNLVKAVLSDYGLKTDPVTDQDISDLDHEYFNKNGWFAVLKSNNDIIGTYGIFRIDNKICEQTLLF